MSKRKKAQPPKPNHLLFIAKVYLFALVLSPTIMLLSFPTKIGKSDPQTSFVQSGQVLITESVSFMWRPPRVNDNVLFYNAIEDEIWFGVVSGIHSDGNVTLYRVTSRKNLDWVVTSDKIYRRVYYPQFRLVDR